MKKQNLNGHKLLDALGALPPDLVSHAAREPEGRERGVFGRFHLGTAVAIAACLAALCLPVLLPILIDNGAMDALKAGSGQYAAENADRGGDTSHEVTDETLDGAWYGEGAVSSESTDGAVTSAVITDFPAWSKVSQEDGAVSSESGIIDSSVYQTETIKGTTPDSWDTTVITAGYDAQGDQSVLPADVYFRYNCQTVKNQIIEADTNEPHTGEAVFTYEDWAQKAIPALEDFVCYEDPFIQGNYDDAGDLTALHTAWHWCRQIAAWESAECMLLMNVSPGPIEGLEWERKVKQAYGETIVKRDGLELTVLGGGDNARVISFDMDGWHYRIYGTWSVPYETIISVLDQVIAKGFDPEAFVQEKGHLTTIVPLDEYSSEPLMAYPTGHEWCDWDPDTGYVWMDKGEPYAVYQETRKSKDNPIYNMEVRDPESPCNPANDRFKNYTLGDLYEITDRQLYELYTENVDFYRRTLPLCFTWEGLEVTINFDFEDSELPYSKFREFVEYLQKWDGAK